MVLIIVMYRKHPINYEHFDMTQCLYFIGSTLGGLRITIEGTGFAGSPGVQLIATLDGAVCEIVEFSVNVIVCQTPPHAEGEIKVETVVGTRAPFKSSTYMFEYSEADTPSVISVEPTAFSTDALVCSHFFI